MKGYQQRSGQAAARRALQNICRVTIRNGDDPPKTAFVNTRTLKVLNFRDWSSMHIMMTSIPHKWKAYSVIISDAWDGENWHQYELTPRVEGRAERFMLTTVTPYFDAAGQEMMEKQRADKVKGHGTILFQNDKELDDDKCLRIFELTLEEGLTYEKVRSLI